MNRLQFIPVDNDDGDLDKGWLIWVKGLRVIGEGPTMADAKADLIDKVRSYVENYLAEIEKYRSTADSASLDPLIQELAAARSDADLLRRLAGPE